MLSIACCCSLYTVRLTVIEGGGFLPPLTNPITPRQASDVQLEKDSDSEMGRQGPQLSSVTPEWSDRCRSITTQGESNQKAHWILILRYPLSEGQAFLPSLRGARSSSLPDLNHLIPFAVGRVGTESSAWHARR